MAPFGPNPVLLQFLAKVLTCSLFHSMQTMQRKFGRLLPRTADESQVAVLLKDFEDADVMLTKVWPPRVHVCIHRKTELTLTQLIESAKAWRDAWRDILTIQQHLVEQFHTLYCPIVGAGPDYQGLEPVETPGETIERVVRLQEAYLELKTDMLDEVNAVDTRIIKPAMEGQAAIQPMKKVDIYQFPPGLYDLTESCGIGHKEETRSQSNKALKVSHRSNADRLDQLDYERYQGRYDATQKKTKRSERENTALAKHESDLARASQVRIFSLL